MTEPDWQEIDPFKHKWLVKIGDDGPLRDHDHDTTRFYVPKGKRQWPLLIIGAATRYRASDMPNRHGIYVFASRKDGPEDWFSERYGTPPALVPKLGELFAALIKKLLAADGA